MVLWISLSKLCIEILLLEFVVEKNKKRIFSTKILAPFTLGF